MTRDQPSSGYWRSGLGPRQRLVLRQELGRLPRQELLQPSAAPFDIPEAALVPLPILPPLLFGPDQLLDGPLFSQIGFQ